MNKMLKKYLITSLFLLISLLVLAIIISIIKFNTNVSFKTLKTISLIMSSIIFLITGILNGIIHKKRGLINGLIMASFYLLIVGILNLLNVNIITSSVIIKTLLLFIGNIIGVNI